MLRLGSGRRARGGTQQERLDLGRLVRERCAKLTRGEWRDLLADSRASAKALADSRRRRSSHSAPDSSHLADEVCRKALAEEYSRAAALLSSPGFAPPTPETAHLLQDLLQPQAAPPLASLPRPGPAPAPFACKLTKRLLHSTPKGSGAALGGARWDHLRVVLASEIAVQLRKSRTL